MVKTQEEKEKEARELLDSLPEEDFKPRSMEERWELDKYDWIESIANSTNQEE